MALTPSVDQVDVRLFGAVELIVAGRSVLRRGRQQTLVAVLALRRNHWVTTDALSDALWSAEPPQDAANALQQVVAHVRRALGTQRGRLESRRGAYRLLLAAHEVDVDRVAHAVDRARGALGRGEIATARAAVVRTVDVRRGAPLDGLAGDALRADVQRLEELAVALALTAADVALAGASRDELNEASERLAQLCALRPLDEALWTKRLHTLAAAGRPAEALRAYGELRSSIAEELGTEPAPELREVHQRLLREDPALRRRSAWPRSVPLPLTTLHGRQAELEALRNWEHAGARLISITGPVGVGKTRLATEFVHGIDRPTVLVELDGLPPHSDVLAGAAAALGVREHGARELLDVLADALAPNAVIVLDNAEHLLDETGVVAAGIAACRPDALVLVTSQRPLGIPGERLLRLGVLDVSGTEEQVSVAAELLLDRAALVRSDLRQPDGSQRRAAAEIARLLDGLPLAIELAGAQAALLPLRELAGQLRESNTLLDREPGHRTRRHGGLSRALQHSVDLLSPEARRLFGWCSVFAGPFHADAAAAVAETDVEAALRLLLDLAERSVVQVTPGDGVLTFRFLRPIRLLGLGELEDAGTSDAARYRLARYLVDLVEAGDEAVRGPEQLVWLAQLDATRGDAESSLAFLLDRGDVATAARIVAALGRSWDWRGRLRDAHRWTAAVVAAADRDSSAAVPRLGAVLAWAAYVALERNEVEEAGRLASAARRAAEERGDIDGLLTAQANEALAAGMRGSYEEAAEHTRQMLRTAQHHELPWAAAWAVNARGIYNVRLGRLDAAYADAIDSVGRFAALGDRRGEMWAVHLHALIAAAQDDRVTAQELAARVKRDAEELDDLRAAANAAELLAELTHDDVERAHLRGLVAVVRDARSDRVDVDRASSTAAPPRR